MRPANSFGTNEIWVSTCPSASVDFSVGSAYRTTVSRRTTAVPPPTSRTA